MLSPFPVPFCDLQLDHLQDFLAAADEEGLTWEAKSDGPEGGGLRPQHMLRSVCGFAYQLGGYLILGAAQVEGGGWDLTGVTSRTAEPKLWIDQVLDGLRPAPRYRVRVLDLPEERWAAVIQVEPLTNTPCMTRNGQVYERVSSRTLAVTDPTRLHELIRRGAQARDRAETQANAWVARQRRRESGAVGVTVSLVMAATSYEPDIGSRLFHSRYRSRFDHRFEHRLFEEQQIPVPSPAVTEHRIGQSFVRRSSEAGDIRWDAAANWDGTASVVASLTGEILKQGSLFDFVIIPAWSLAADLVEALGGYGDAHIRLLIDVKAIHSYLGSFYRGLGRTTEVSRWSDVAPAGSDLIGSVQRELHRAAGFWTFEGEPDLPQAPT
ncbi:ATP-binding protein [Svornostia abyssi]|uniref:ATP-binding protein n=1 Tax=Svornostia abyssi TaxID=2898438 RepID=A0ABY5PAV6_9ACTN|nr:ATP-binding protein [Parviterribacteraceae bacterium J379]